MSVAKPGPCSLCGGSGELEQGTCDNCIGVGVDPMNWHPYIVWLKRQVAAREQALRANGVQESGRVS